MAKGKLLTIKVSDEELKLWKAEARKTGLSVSAFIRLLFRQWNDGIRFEQREEKKEESND